MSLREKASWQPGGGVSQAGAGAHVADLQITKSKDQGHNGKTTAGESAGTRWAESGH